MVKTRLIPILLLQNGMLVRAERFRNYQIIGNPIVEVQRYNEWAVDEIIYLDITHAGEYDQRRRDTKHTGMNDPFTILEKVSETCFIPLTWGGRIRTIEDMRKCFRQGADKITINTAAVENSELITQGALKFGSQAIVASIDVLRSVNGELEVITHCGQHHTGKDPLAWSKESETRGAGEILLQSIDRDGMACGYDLDLVHSVAQAVNIPVIACSGAGDYKDYVKVVEAGADAVAAANIWHFKEMSDVGGKMAMAKAGLNIRHWK
jgi:cyclase